MTAFYVGMRFDPRDAPLLRRLADEIKRGEVVGDAQIYESAEIAALAGEPLKVVCDDQIEARLMVAGFVRQGCRPPSLERLTGHRPK